MRFRVRGAVRGAARGAARGGVGGRPRGALVNGAMLLLCAVLAGVLAFVVVLTPRRSRIGRDR